MTKLIKIDEAASLLGVSIKTLQRWDGERKLIANRTLGGHRRYKLSDILNLVGE